MKKQIERSALVWYSAQEMFELVNDVRSYPEFLPWCASAEIHEESAEHLMASLEVAKSGVRQSFTTRNWLEHPRRIGIELVDGPFTRLRGEWVFQPLDERACKVMLSLEFALQGRVARLAFGNVFSQAANNMVDAFCQRAEHVYSEKEVGGR